MKPEGKGGSKKERVEIDFRAVKIKSCEEVKKSDKLLKFVLNDGSGEEMLILLLVDDRIPAGAKLY